jgi:hypothetical protein
MGQKLVCFGPLRATRSRQDAPREVHEVGSKRPSLGGNGGHVLSLYPLIWRSLPNSAIPARPSAFGAGPRRPGHRAFY